MELILIGALNAVLFVLLLVAIALIRSPDSKRARATAASTDPATTEAGRRSRRQRRKARKAAEKAPAQQADVRESTEDPAVDPHEVTMPVATPMAPGPDNRLFRVDHRPDSLRPSHIRLVSGLNGSGPSRAELVGGVINSLLPLGLSLQRVDAHRSRLISPEGRTAAVNADQLDDGRDHIEIVIDSTLAPEALVALRQWHRFELDTTDRVHISAQIH